MRTRLLASSFCLMFSVSPLSFFFFFFFFFLFLLLVGFFFFFFFFFFPFFFLFSLFFFSFFFFFFFSSRRRHTRYRYVTGVQTCALPISLYLSTWPPYALTASARV